MTLPNILLVSGLILGCILSLGAVVLVIQQWRNVLSWLAGLAACVGMMVGGWYISIYGAEYSVSWMIYTGLIISVMSFFAGIGVVFLPIVRSLPKCDYPRDDGSDYAAKKDLEARQHEALAAMAQGRGCVYPIR